jgi:hypothetical protein
MKYSEKFKKKKEKAADIAMFILLISAIALLAIIV